MYECSRSKKVWTHRTRDTLRTAHTRGTRYIAHTHHTGPVIVTDRLNFWTFVKHSYMHTNTWYVLCVLVRPRGVTQDQESLSRTNREIPTTMIFWKAPTKNRVETTQRVTHGPQRTHVTHVAEHAQTFDGEVRRPDIDTHPDMPNQQRDPICEKMRK